MKFDILYHFSHGTIHLIETKRLDLPASAGPSEVYRWSLVEDGTVRPLKFVSMNLTPQQRIFGEGSITFDLNSCQGKLFGKDFDLLRHEGLSDRLKMLLSESLKERSVR
ncbi:MAG: hypothetical protein V4598_11010 [Bdellovibrionota bacterium]